MKQEKVLIVGNGEKPDPEIVSTLNFREFFVLAADGGSDNCEYLDIKPDIIIGDLDSITTKSLKSGQSVIKDPDQETTDLEKALNYAASLSPVRISVIGFSGLRSDHFLNNIITLMESPLSEKITFYDLYGKMFFLNSGDHLLSTEAGKILSFFALTPITSLKLDGFLYTVNIRNHPGFFHSISNVTKKETSVVSFEGGKLIVYEKN
jgi:thiamine pyrophosphokinase